MELGLAFAQLGPFANPESVRSMAVAAEGRGYTSLWVIDRLLDPVEPRTPYPATLDGSLPPEQKIALDPFVTLATAAALTTTIRIGTNVVVVPWYRPVLLTRALASLDVLSGGRLDIGLGLGWSADEFAAAGVAHHRLAARQEQLLDIFDAVWGSEIVTYDDGDVRIAPSGIRPKPVQTPRPPVLLAAYSTAGLVRAGRRADGWTPSGLSLADTEAMWSVVTAAAADAGRDPSMLSLVVRANIHHRDRPAGPGRPTYHGSVDQIADDVRGAFALGARQVILDLQGTTRDVAAYLDLADAIADAGDLRSAA
ncbi:MAG: TIGR03619 family F420-dependent LLM class oxidoreductase [Actinomycetota bacterium]